MNNSEELSVNKQEVVGSIPAGPIDDRVGSHLTSGIPGLSEKPPLSLKILVET